MTYLFLGGLGTGRRTLSGIVGLEALPMGIGPEPMDLGPMGQASMDTRPVGPRLLDPRPLGLLFPLALVGFTCSTAAFICFAPYFAWLRNPAAVTSDWENCRLGIGKHLAQGGVSHANVAAAKKGGCVTT